MSEKIERRGLGALSQRRRGGFPGEAGPFDKVVSIGVLEHAGRDQLDEVSGRTPIA